MEQLLDKMQSEEGSLDEYNPENGLCLSCHYIPGEVLTHILSFVDVESLAFRCRLVCRRWKEIVQGVVFKLKIEQQGLINFRGNSSLIQKLHWVDYYWILYKKPIGLNLLENNCGQNKLNFWEILSSGGDGWVVEREPVGAEGLPPLNARHEPHPDFNGLTSCFASSYVSCSKQQIIDLEAQGLTGHFMDHAQPPIEISEWTACRFDCGSVYELKVSLLDGKKMILTDFQERENFSRLPRETWHQVKHVFKEYGPGVRYIQFYHGGMDSQFWAGHYGSKMSGGSVKVLRNEQTVS